jgi:hypothetical protein
MRFDQLDTHELFYLNLSTITLSEEHIALSESAGSPL